MVFFSVLASLVFPSLLIVDSHVGLESHPYDLFNLVTSLKAYLQIPSHWGLGLQQINSGEGMRRNLWDDAISMNLKLSCYPLYF